MNDLNNIWHFLNNKNLIYLFKDRVKNNINNVECKKNN